MANKTCFVIMGFGVKNNLNLDLTYEMIIKPCIKGNKLIPFPLYSESKYNAFRCDEISGTTAIDYNFVTCLSGADIVIADISTMNINAIYELGARHALKSRSTILLCAKERRKEFNFFDITYVPIIFYEHAGKKIDESEIKKIKGQLNQKIDFCINSSSVVPDNPIRRAIDENQHYKKISPVNVKDTLYSLYKDGIDKIDNNKYEQALPLLNELFNRNKTEENLLLLTLCQYKIFEKRRDCNSLNECANLILQNINIEECHSGEVFGRLGAIYLRMYNLTNDKEFYYSALKYYRKGAECCSIDLYCQRNYCALLCRICELTDDINVVKEYYYTAKHYAKLYIDGVALSVEPNSYEDKLYLYFNKNDLKAIIFGDADICVSSLNRLMEKGISKRMSKTVQEGVVKLKEYIIRLEKMIAESLQNI